MIAAPPVQAVGVDVWGQPARSAEVAGRPLGSTLGVFLRGRTVVIPSWHGQRLDSLPAQMKADTGSFIRAKARAVGGLYLVPTANGWLCMQGDTFETCHRGLLRAGITYAFQVTDETLLVFGIASDAVRRVSLMGRAVTVRDNVFILSQSVHLAPGHVPKTFGTLTVTYRDGRPARHVPLH